MFDEPNESPADRPTDPAVRAKDKADELRMHADLAAVFEGHRKFDAELRTDLPADTARDVQRRIGRLEKAKSADSPLLPDSAADEARELLNLPQAGSLTTNDYHVHRRPGEVMIVRWLTGEQVETFYTRLQAHFDVALADAREDERQALGWKQDPATLAYLDALDALEVKMAERYLREPIRTLGVFVLSTLAIDEMNIAHVCDYLIGLPAADVVGAASAPPDEPTEQDLTWFFKLFSLRGSIDGVERMCFFTYLQKTDDGGW